MNDEDGIFIEAVAGHLARDYFDKHGVKPHRNARRAIRRQALRNLIIAKAAKRAVESYK